MKERYLLAHQHEVQSILAGRQSQFRRVIKPQPEGADYWTVIHVMGLRDSFYPNTTKATPARLACPYGQSGDMLWVRETWRVNRTYDDLPPRLVYDAMGGDVAYCVDYRADGQDVAWGGRWRPSIHMPRWASRLTLRVTAVRVEQVQVITYSDALAEGCPTPSLHDEIPPLRDGDGKIVRPGLVGPVAWFANLWDSINAKRGYGWDTNRWVWVVEF